MSLFIFWISILYLLPTYGLWQIISYIISTLKIINVEINKCSKFLIDILVSNLY